jgi:uncharacterized protein (TIGR02217 family)
MSFKESPRFPDEVSAWMVGGEEFTTDIVIVNSGSEQRNAVWAIPLRKYSLSSGLRTIANAQATKAFFRAVSGRLSGFRVKDIFDYTADHTTGIIGAGIGTGMPTYQLAKNYIIGSMTTPADIKKPVVSTVSVRRGGVDANMGTGAGQWAVDTTTGIVTVIADATSNASSITANATTQVVLASNPGTLTNGQNLYLSGFTGGDANLVNGLAHTINTISGNGPYTFTLATNTAGKTITLGAGVGAKYPQASETLTWSGEFDIPVRFDVDWLQIGLNPGGLLDWSQANLVELRNP